MPFQFSTSRAPRTTAEYESVWGDWERYAASIGANVLPAAPEAVLDFLRARKRTHSTSALSNRKSAIIAAHVDARTRLPNEERAPYMLDHDDMLKLGWREIMREKGNRHTPRKAFTLDDIHHMTRQMDLGTAIGVMDRAIHLVSWTILMRRSEVAALNVDDIEFKDDLMYVHIRRSKTDQSGEGKILAAAPTGNLICPVTAMREWMDRGNPSTEEVKPLFFHPKFKSARRIDDTYPYLLAKKYVSMIGKDPTPYGHHSYRRGGITHINDSGVAPKDGMSLSRHKTPGIYYGYIADKEAAKNPAIHALARPLDVRPAGA